MILSGGPGCGKTLSLNLVIKSLRGNEALNTFFQHYPFIYPVFY